MQTNNDISANTASTDAISTKPAIVWRGDWVSDLDGIYETRAVVSAAGTGFLPRLECWRRPKIDHLNPGLPIQI